MFDWTKLYTKLFQDASPDLIVQTLNRIILNARNKGDKTIEDIARKIFMKLAETFSLKFSTIDKITKAPNESIIAYEHEYGNVTQEYNNSSPNSSSTSFEDNHNYEINEFPHNLLKIGRLSCQRRRNFDNHTTIIQLFFFNCRDVTITQQPSCPYV